MSSTLQRILSPREREVLGLLARGHTQREIAGILSISIKTVESHKANGMRKIGCERRADLLRHAIDHQWPLCEGGVAPHEAPGSIGAVESASHELLARLHVILGCCDLAGSRLTPERALAIIQRNARAQMQPIETLIESATVQQR